MRVVIQVRIHHDADVDGELIDVAEISRDGSLSGSTVGLTIDEAKRVLAGIEWDVVVTEQAAQAVARASECCECGRRFASKDSRTIVLRSRYGTHHLRVRAGGGARVPVRSVLRSVRLPRCWWSGSHRSWRWWRPNSLRTCPTKPLVGFSKSCSRPGGASIATRSRAPSRGRLPSRRWPSRRRPQRMAEGPVRRVATLESRPRRREHAERPDRCRASCRIRSRLRPALRPRRRRERHACSSLLHRCRRPTCSHHAEPVVRTHLSSRSDSWTRLSSRICDRLA